MLVYEYVDNGNLEQWLHGDVGPVSPLTWDIRMKIAIGTAKGCSILVSLSLSFLVTNDANSVDFNESRKRNNGEFHIQNFLGTQIIFSLSQHKLFEHQENSECGILHYFSYDFH